MLCEDVKERAIHKELAWKVLKTWKRVDSRMADIEDRKNKKLVDRL